MIKEKILKEIERNIMDYCQKEYDEDYSYEDFDKLFPDKSRIPLAYTTTPDEKYEIQFELDLEKKRWIQHVNNVIVSSGSYFDKDYNEKRALENMARDTSMFDFNELVRIDEDDLLENLCLRMDEDGNFY